MPEVEVIKATEEARLNQRGRNQIARMRVAAYCRVSTDGKEQLESYQSQVTHYTDLIQSKPEWDFAGIYADEAITGTMVSKRDNFKRLMDDCMAGIIDMVITKSISRFARNTLDVLQYVRKLRDNNVAVYFEEENINTMTMDGELLLTILSSVYQQEVENTSSHVKKGLQMKMQRGEMVGFNSCLGYDYNQETKEISINIEEAEIVKYIFRRYLEGAGTYIIAKELEELGYLTKKGNSKWNCTTVRNILTNEKYKGVLLSGKTFTVNPITKRRLKNKGESDQFLVKDHHERIISDEDFDRVQEIRLGRSLYREHIVNPSPSRHRNSHKFAFSGMMYCGFCGRILSRRRAHAGTKYVKVVWQCLSATHQGKKHCPDCKAIDEEAIERAFMESYSLVCKNNDKVISEFLDYAKETLNTKNMKKKLRNCP